MKVFGWRVEGDPPADKRYVFIAAPHTSNWDGVFMVAMALYYGLKVRWMVKHTIYRFPFRWFLDRLGAVPIERHLQKGVVEQMISRFDTEDEFILVVPPEGTRSHRGYWKSGFYHVARGANVPVCLSYLDWGTKTTGCGPTNYMTGDVGADMDEVRAFYAGKVGKFPDKSGPIRLCEEDEPQDNVIELPASVPPPPSGRAVESR